MPSTEFSSSPQKNGIGLLIAVVAALVVLVAPGTAHALGIGNMTVTPASAPAGSHPNVVVDIPLTDAGDKVKDLRVDLPPGFVGNPQAATICSAADFAADSCAASATVGTTQVTANAILPGIVSDGDVYRLAPPPGEPARLGVIVRPLGGLLGKFSLIVRVSLRTDDYGLTTTIADMPNSLNGIPVEVTDIRLTLNGAAANGPFVSLPTSCAPTTIRVSATSYAAPNTAATGQAPLTPTDCANVPFSPGAGIALETTRTDTPSGYSVTLALPATETPRRQSHVKRAEVVLPEGTVLSPGVSNGLQACSDGAFGAGSPGPAACPATSQIGTVAFETPLLGTLGGNVYFGQPLPGNPLRLFVAVDDGATGLRIKLRGVVTASASGRLTTVFDDLPQVPFTRFTLSFQGGDRAVLANPRGCGTYTMITRLTPWAAADQGFPPSRDAAPAAAFSLSADGAGAACGPTPFTPTLAVSAGNTQAAGDPGSLTISIDRPDRQQRLSNVATSLAPGMLGKLASVPFCPDEGAAAGACGAESRVGTATTSAGGGGSPVGLSGPVYLTGPFGGGLVGLSIVVPAKVGPLDLGNVVVRAGLFLRTTDGGIDVRTTDLPTSLAGIPIDMRNLTLTLNRPGFLLNPSSCATQFVHATLRSTEGAIATPSAPFTATGCDRVPFSPRVEAIVGTEGRPAPREGAPTPVTVAIIQNAGESSTRDATVTLPKELGANLAAFQSLCSTAQAGAHACPASTKAGTALVRSPLIPFPLTGNVYASRPATPGLPGLVVQLNPPIPLKLDGKIALGRNGEIVSTFSGVPDVPLSRFELKLDRAVSPSRNLCTRPPRVSGRFVAHAGKTATASRTIRVLGCRSSATARPRHRTSISVRRASTSRPTVRILVRRTAGVALRRFTVKLSRALKVNPRRVRRGVFIRAKGRLISRRVWTLSRRGTLTVRKVWANTRRLTITLNRGSVTPSRTLRRRAAARRGTRPLLGFRVQVFDVRGARATLRLRARAGR